MTAQRKGRPGETTEATQQPDQELSPQEKGTNQMVSPEAGAEQGARTTSPNGQGPEDDPYDPVSLWVDGNTDVDIEEMLTTVPARKPKRNEFFRVHPGAEYTTDTYVLEHGDGMDTETYLVLPAARGLVADDLKLVRLFRAINKSGNEFLWPAKLPREDNRAGRRWAETALMGAELAKTQWVKIRGNMGLGAYDIMRAKRDFGDPQWRDDSFRDLIKTAFGDRLIDGPDHPVVRDILGDL